MIPLVLETPRYLINHGKSEKGLRNLTLLRKLPVDHPYVQTEFQEIEAQFFHEQEVRKGHNYGIVLKDVFTDRSNFQRFFLVSRKLCIVRENEYLSSQAVMLFLFHKLTGTDSLVRLALFPCNLKPATLTMLSELLRASHLRAHRCQSRVI